MSWTWRDGPVVPGRSALIDIDGVISDASHRQDHAERRDWTAFFGAAVDDPPIDSLIALLALLDRSVSVVLLTARPGWLREATVDWLLTNGVRWDLLVMRDGESRDASWTFKQREVQKLRAEGFDLVVALEDDLRNVAMLQEEGIYTVYIHSGYYE